MSTSLEDTVDHIHRVRTHLQYAQGQLFWRGVRHDASKLEDPERAGYASLHAQMQGVAYGTPEYQAVIAAHQDTVQHHYAANDHHIEHHPIPESEEIDLLRKDAAALAKQTPVGGGALARTVVRLETNLAHLESRVHGMSLFSLIEWLCDLKAAGDIPGRAPIAQVLESIITRKGIEPQLASVLRNTLAELGCSE